MTDLFTYLLKVNIAIALFYLIYHLWLRNLTFYRVNRYFLIFSLVFSMLYPVINWNWLQSPATVPVEVSNVLPVWEYQYTTSQQVSISEYLDGVFYLTVIVFGLRLCISLFGILKIHRSSKASIWKAYAYRRSDEDILPFSFWKNVYLNPSKHKEQELEGIFRHEYVHVRQMHSIDILLSEVVLIICWYNPLVWLFRRAIQENIEFITDNNVLASGINKQEYQYSLLTVIRSAKQPVIANYFNMKDLKKRISMMNKKRTSNFHIIKYVILLPLVIGCLSVVTISEAKQRSAVPHEMVEAIMKMNASKPMTVTDTRIVGTGTIKMDTIDKKAPSVEFVKTEKIDTLKENQGSQGLQIRHTSPDKNPLYVIDGEITDLTDIGLIDTDEIESISVLKGYHAETRYGRDGENGVILITLKKNETTHISQSDTTSKKSAAISIEGKKLSRTKYDQENSDEFKAVRTYNEKDATKL